MKFLVTFILLSFFFLSGLSGQTTEGLQLKANFKNLTFQEMVDKLESQYPVHFYYDEKWVDSLKVNMETQQISITDLMDKILGSTTLGYVYQPPGTVFILPDKKFAHQLPAYFYSSEGSENAQNRQQELTEMEQKYLQGRQPDMIRTIVIGSREKARKGKMAVITGKLTDEETGEILIGATINIPALHKGAVTDATGFFTMSLMPGVYAAEFQYLGMNSLKGNLDVRSDGYFTLSLKKQFKQIEEVLIQGQKLQKHGAKPGMENISARTMKELPALMGEKDVLKMAQMLPGIVSVGEGSAGINVRGGNADQNLFYLNEIPIYNSSHLFGFFSSINSTIIENFSIYKGQVPVEYGGRLSSVFNVETRKGHKKKLFSQGGVSPISAYAELELPIVKEKASLVVSGRSSYSDWMLKRIKDADIRNSKASFYDGTLSLDYNLNKKNQISVFAYNSHDNFNLNSYTQYGYDNKGASANYTHRFSPGMKLSASLIGSNYSFETTDKRSETEAYTHSYELNHYELRSSVSWIINQHQTIKVGTEDILYQLNRGMVKPYGPASMKTALDLQKEYGLETTVFLDDNIEIGSRVNLYGGLRYSLFTALGPKTIRNYTPSTSFDDMNVSGIQTYQKGEKIITYHNPEFRAGMDIKVRKNNSVKFSVTQMTQYLFMLSNSIAIAPNDQWKLVDSHLTPPRSIQYSGGYYLENPKTGLSFSTEVYYKKAEHIVEFRDGADFLGSPYVETAVLQGDQQAFGAEFMISKSTGRFNGWTTYTFSRSFIKVDGTQDWADINKGEQYPSNFDKPHVLNTILNYQFNRRLSVSSNIAYSTGRPATIPKGIYYIAGHPYVDYSKRNEYRLPDYLRMDLSMKVEGNLRQKKLMHSYWTISVYNLLGRNNANSIFYLSEKGGIHGYKYSVIGVPILTISWNWKLGNYENN
jgi:hypothetical protein